MKVSVSIDACCGHARCQDICPEVFGTDDFEGKCLILVENIPEYLQRNARMAVMNCPEGALQICDE